MEKIHHFTAGVQAYIEQGQAQLEAQAQHRAIMRQKRYDTIAVHGMYGRDAARANQGSIIEPLYMSPAQHFEDSDQLEAALAYLIPAWGYTRLANPTLYYLEQTVALLEGYGYDGDMSACATASGMAAVFMATNPFLIETGDPMNIVVSAKCYGGTFMLFAQRYGAERGIDIRWVRNPYDLDEWASKIDAQTRFVYGEMPSNPSIAVFDIAKVAELAHHYDAPLIVDTTVATSALLRPLLHGADIVVHSMSKSMISSGFAIAGAFIAKHNITCNVGTDEMRRDFATYAKLLPGRDYGPALSPMSALMALNDLRTIRHKMDVYSRNTQHIAEFLAEHPNVETVHYPGLPSHAGHTIAKKYMWLADGEDDYDMPVNRYGHLLSFTVDGDAMTTRAVFDRLQMIWRATDLGRIKSVATIPAISTHQQQGDEGRDLADIPSNLIRLNIGAEHYKDIIDDLAQALEVV